MLKLARRVRRRRYSRKVAGGLAFLGTSLVGGFVSSIGADLYHSIKSAFSSQAGFPLSFPQLIFLIIGLAGIGLLISGLTDDKPRARRKNRGLFAAIHGVSLML